MRAFHTIEMKTPSGDWGFTLMELLIGMAIFAIGALAIAGLQTHSVNTNANARRSLEVETVVARMVENYKNLPWYDTNPADNLMDDLDLDGDGTIEDLRLRDVTNDGNNGMDGIDNLGAAADYRFTGSDPQANTNDDYQFFINVAPNASVPNSLTINIIAQWTHLGQTKTYSVLFLKARDV